MSNEEIKELIIKWESKKYESKVGDNSNFLYAIGFREGFTIALELVLNSQNENLHSINNNDQK